MSRATLPALFAAVRAAGGTVEEEHERRYVLDAPHGKVWTATGAHWIACWWDGSGDRAGAIRVALDEVRGGVRPCEYCAAEVAARVAAEEVQS